MGLADQISNRAVHRLLHIRGGDQLEGVHDAVQVLLIVCLALERSNHRDQLFALRQLQRDFSHQTLQERRTMHEKLGAY